MKFGSCDLSEATHLISEMQFYQKADDVRRKAAMRGGGRIKHVRSLDDVLTNESIGEERKKKAPPLTRDSSAGKLVLELVYLKIPVKFHFQSSTKYSVTHPVASR